MFSQPIRKGLELWSYVEHCKTKKCFRPPWFQKKVENAISMTSQALKRFRVTPTALNKTTRVKLSQKTSFSVNEAKFVHFQMLFFRVTGTSFKHSMRL